MKKGSHPGRYFDLPSAIPSTLFKYSRALLRKFSTLDRGLWEFPDSFATPHNVSFFFDEEFQDSYTFAKNFVGIDYRIPWRIHQAIWAAHSTRRLEGAMVEVGTGRGFTMAAVLRSLERSKANSRKVYLFDTFEPPPLEDPVKSRFSAVYADNPEDVVSKFERFVNVELVVGNVFDTLSSWVPERISFLHVDLNDAGAELFCLRNLWPWLLPGAIVLFDDYANKGLEEQYEAVGALMREFGHPVLTTPSGQGIVVYQGVR